MSMSLKDKIIFVTGASSGIGEACVRGFAAAGARLLIAARRRDRLDKLAAELKVPCHCLTLDVRDRAAVEAAVAHLPAEWTSIDILLNNAGLARGIGKIYDADQEDWDEMIDTNVKGLLYISHAVIPGMVERGHGHIINIGSLAGHDVYPGGSVYCSTKASVKALTFGMRLDLHGTGIRVSSVDPGLCETEFSLVRFHGDSERAAKAYHGVRPLTGADIAEVVLFCATRQEHVNIVDVLVTPTAQSAISLVARKQ